MITSTTDSMIGERRQLRKRSKSVKVETATARDERPQCR